MPRPVLKELLNPVFQGQQPLELVYTPKSGDQPVAEGFTLERTQVQQEGEQAFEWQESYLVLHSFKFAEGQQRQLDQRLDQAEAALNKLNTKTGRGHKRLTPEETQAEVEKILKQHRVSDLLQVDYQITTETAHKRAYKDRPARVVTTSQVEVRVERNLSAYQDAVKLLGWRVYVTSDLQLSLQEAVCAYREQYLVERSIGRLKGHPLGLTPVYLQSEERVKGLIRLLSLALRVLCLVEFTVRQSLEEEGEMLAGLYPGNPKRATTRPTTELLLRAFRGITLTVVSIDGKVCRLLSSLSELQKRILNLLRVPHSIYSVLTG